MEDVNFCRTCYSLPRLHSCHENAFLDILQAQYQPAAESVTFHGTPELIRNGDIIISANGAALFSYGLISVMEPTLHHYGHSSYKKQTFLGSIPSLKYHHNNQQDHP